MLCNYCTTYTKWQKCNLVSRHGLCGSQLGRAMNWMDRPHTSIDEWMWSGRRAVVIAWWAGAGFGRFFTEHSFLREQSPWSFSGLARIPACSPTEALCTAAFPPIFPQLRKGPLWSCTELLQSYALCSSVQCRTVKLRLPAVRELFWCMLGRGDGGWRSIGVSGSG